MSILIIGGNGNMGGRYKSILNFLKKDFVTTDKEHNKYYTKELAQNSDGIIITTPTETHEHYIRLCMDLGKPILCEKPVTKDTHALKNLVLDLAKAGTNFSMVYQYSMYMDGTSQGPSYYDYYKHGNDGLVWDCIQIIGLAKGEIELREKSPVWKCRINGQKLHIGLMDLAYVEFIKKWISNPGQDLGYIREVHEKTAQLERNLRHV